MHTIIGAEVEPFAGTKDDESKLHEKLKTWREDVINGSEIKSTAFTKAYETNFLTRWFRVYRHYQTESTRRGFWLEESNYSEKARKAGIKVRDMRRMLHRIEEAVSNGELEEIYLESKEALDGDVDVKVMMARVWGTDKVQLYDAKEKKAQKEETALWNKELLKAREKALNKALSDDDKEVAEKIKQKKTAKAEKIKQKKTAKEGKAKEGKAKEAAEEKWSVTAEVDAGDDAAAAKAVKDKAEAFAEAGAPAALATALGLSATSILSVAAPTVALAIVAADGATAKDMVTIGFDVAADAYDPAATSGPTSPAGYAAALAAQMGNKPDGTPYTAADITMIWTDQNADGTWSGTAKVDAGGNAAAVQAAAKQVSAKTPEELATALGLPAGSVTTAAAATTGVDFVAAEGTIAKIIVTLGFDVAADAYDPAATSGPTSPAGYAAALAARMGVPADAITVTPVRNAGPPVTNTVASQTEREAAVEAAEGAEAAEEKQAKEEEAQHVILDIAEEGQQEFDAEKEVMSKRLKLEIDVEIDTQQGDLPDDHQSPVRHKQYSASSPPHARACDCIASHHTAYSTYTVSQTA